MSNFKIPLCSSDGPGLYLHPCFVYAIGEGSDETGRMHRLV